MNLKKWSRDASASTDNSAKTKQAKSGTYSQTEKIDQNNLGKHSPVDTEGHKDLLALDSRLSILDSRLSILDS